uniref:Transcriptional activator protein n=1 Tax=Pouzolzia golden mosaic virus TaxID=1225069 RepID=A0A1L6Z3L8_9GEMI|nr:transcriptional activation protein [Pouzolzia golden mosaic virus]
MRSSSPSTGHSTQIPIKVKHRLCKKKTIRRRRVDLPCGCTYYYSIDCANHGFTHRGTHHCNSSREWRVYLDGTKSPLFQDHQARTSTVTNEPRHHHNTNPIQPQPEESVGTSPMFSDLPDLDSFTTSDWAFLKSI